MRTTSQLAARPTPRALKLVGARYIVPSSQDHHTYLPPVAPLGKIGPCSGRSLDRFFAILERASFFFICSAGLSCKGVPPASLFYFWECGGPIPLARPEGRPASSCFLLVFLRARGCRIF